MHSKKFLGRRQKNSEVRNWKLQFFYFRPTFGPIWPNFTFSDKSWSKTGKLLFHFGPRHFPVDAPKIVLSVTNNKQIIHRYIIYPYSNRKRFYQGCPPPFLFLISVAHKSSKTDQSLKIFEQSNTTGIIASSVFENTKRSLTIFYCLKRFKTVVLCYE